MCFRNICDQTNPLRRDICCVTPNYTGSKRGEARREKQTSLYKALLPPLPSASRAIWAIPGMKILLEWLERQCEKYIMHSFSLLLIEADTSISGDDVIPAFNCTVVSRDDETNEWAQPTTVTCDNY